MNIIFISTILLLNFLSSRGGADFEVERVHSPYVENRDLGPLMSQRPSMPRDTFNNFQYPSYGPERSYSSWYGYQQGTPCISCGQNSKGSGYSSSSSNSYGSSSSNYGSVPAGSNYYDGNYGRNVYQPPVQSSSSKHELKEEKEFVDGQQVYDLHHEKRFKDGNLIYNTKKEKGPEDFGVSSSNTHNSHGSYGIPNLGYGSSGSSSSHSYSQDTAGTESNPVKFASRPHTTNANAQKEIYSSGTNYENGNTYPIEDNFHRDFQSEVERLREEMRQKTFNYHQDSLSSSPIIGNSHRTEYNTQTKYINGKPVYTKKEERKYKDGKLIHNITKENDLDNHESQNLGYFYPARSDSASRIYSQQNIGTQESRLRNPNIAAYPAPSYYDQSPLGNDKLYGAHTTQTSSSYSNTNSHLPVISTKPANFNTHRKDISSSDYSGSTYRRPVYNSHSSPHYDYNYKTKDTYHPDTSNRYSPNYEQKTNPRPHSYDYPSNRNEQSSDSYVHRPYSGSTYSQLSQGTYQSKDGSYSSPTNIPNRSPSNKDRIDQSSHDTARYNFNSYANNRDDYRNYPERNEDREPASTYSYNSIKSEGQTSSHSRPVPQESSVIKQSEISNSHSRYSPTYKTEDDEDSREDQPEDETPSYAAYSQQPLDERPYTSAVYPKVLTDNEEKIEEDKERYDISPYDGLPALTNDENGNEPQETTTQPALVSSNSRYNPYRPSYGNTQTNEQSRSTSDHSVTHVGREQSIPSSDIRYPHQNEHSTYDSSTSTRYGSSHPSYENNQSYEESLQSTSDHSTSQFGRQRPTSSFNSRNPDQSVYSTYNSSRYEHQVSNSLPSRWVETRTTWKYVNGLLVSETQYHKYYENGIMIHENETERSRDQMKAEGVDVFNLDLTPSELALYGSPGAARSHSQKHELHQMKRFKNGQPIYELNHERLFQDGDLIHENHTEKQAEDFKDQHSGNHQLLQRQRLNQHSITHPGTIATSGFRESEGFSVHPKTSVRRHEIRQEQEFVDGQKVYDLHHEKEFRDGQLVNENKTELGPDDLNVRNAPHRDALKDILAGRSTSQVSHRALNQQGQTAHNILTTSCLTCNSHSRGQVGGYVDPQSNAQSKNAGSFGSQRVPSLQGYGGSSYRKEFEVEEHYENGKLVKGKEEKKHWRDGQLVDQDSNTYFQGPSRVDTVSHDAHNTPSRSSASSLGATSSNSRSRGRCATNPCQNGGRCRMSITGEICLCRFGFKGNRCDEAYCPSRYCRYGGTCSILAGEHECECPDGYKGQRCATREITISLGASGL